MLAKKHDKIIDVNTQIEMIPVKDALKKDSECPICLLMKEAENDAVRYYLSSAIMVPEIRVETNKHGFCPHHLSMLSEGGKPQALALVMDTYYGESEKTLYPAIDRVISSTSGKKALKAAEAFIREASNRESGCLICSRMDERLDRYAATFACLWREEEGFRKDMEESKGFCVHHTAALVEAAGEYLSGDDLAGFLICVFKLLRNNLDRVRHDDWWMTQKYKSENKDAPWNGCEDAHKRAVNKIIGEARVIDSLE